MFGTRRTYLDWAAVAPVTAAAVRAYKSAMPAFGNPSSPHAEGRAAHDVLETARAAIARELAAKADDLIFTSGATEANTIAIAGHVRALIAAGRASNRIHLLYLPSAHASVVETMRALTREGCCIEPLAIRDGAIDIEQLKTQISQDTALVSIDAVCGETGIIWNAREVRHALDAARAPGEERILLQVDASQAPLTQSLEKTRFGADLMTLDASKTGSVRGFGVLVAPRTLPLASLMHGGGQERGIRPGTELPAHAAAFAAALIECRAARDAFAARATRARESLVAQLVQAAGTAAPAATRIYINEGKRQAPNILNLSLLGRDTDYLVALLDHAGFAVSTKSACETDSQTGSRAVFALSNDAARAASTLRISWGPSTASRDLSRFAAALVRSVGFLDAAHQAG